MQRGVYVDHKVTFPKTTDKMRTDAQYHTRNGKPAPFNDLALGMVTGFPFAYMHCVCLGVMRKLISLWLESPFQKAIRLEAHVIRTVDEVIVSDGIQSSLTSVFPRRIRGWSEFRSWKAVEFRQFLLYVGPVVLYGKIEPAYYSNFLHLSVAIYILCHPSLHLDLLEYADSLLGMFVRGFYELYGPGEMTYNVHSLCHLASDVKLHGTLDSFSAFVFESNLGKLKRMLKNAVNPAAQICRRLAERRGAGILIDEPLPVTVPQRDGHGNKFVIVRGTTYSTVRPNNVCIAEGVPHQIVDVRQGTEHVEVICQKFLSYEPFWEMAIPSTDILVFKCSTTVSSDCTTYHLEDIDCKCVCLPVEKALVILPLLHTHTQSQ
jgi:hypothetical protein